MARGPERTGTAPQPPDSTQARPAEARPAEARPIEAPGALAAEIQRRLAGRIGLLVEVREVEDAIVLTGRAESSAARIAARRLAAACAPGRRIVNRVRVAPDRVAAAVEQRDAEAGADTGEPPDLTSAEDAEAERAGFPPTDPVITVGPHGQVEVLGGFSPTAIADLEAEPTAEDARSGDEALADAVRRELHADAATTDLPIHILVRRGIVRLRGRVPDLEDAENAEAVAARVPGVREVVEALDVGEV